MRANTTPRIPGDPDLERELRQHASLINALSDGLMTGTNSATTAAPTSGAHARGDYVRNSQPSELGTAGSKYVLLGWVCTVEGTPGTWVQCRSLTGN